MSADHAISEATLEDFGSSTVTRRLNAAKTIQVPLSSYGIKVLCKRHNSSLSPIDEVGRRFVAACKRQREHPHIRNSGDEIHALFNGYDVERWMLKVLCTLSHDAPISRLGPSPKWHVPAWWARILFEGRPFSLRTGLYTPRIRRGRADRGFLIAMIIGDMYDRTQTGRPLLGTGKRAVLGISISLYGADFDLLMSPPLDPTDLVYRARMHRLRSNAGGCAYLHLGWEEAPPTFAGLGGERRLWREVKDDLLR